MVVHIFCTARLAQRRTDHCVRYSSNAPSRHKHMYVFFTSLETGKCVQINRNCFLLTRIGKTGGWHISTKKLVTRRDLVTRVLRRSAWSHCFVNSLFYKESPANVFCKLKRLCWSWIRRKELQDSLNINMWTLREISLCNVSLEDIGMAIIRKRSSNWSTMSA